MEAIDRRKGLKGHGREWAGWRAMELGDMAGAAVGGQTAALCPCRPRSRWPRLKSVSCNLLETLDSSLVLL